MNLKSQNIFFRHEHISLYVDTFCSSYQNESLFRMEIIL